MSPHPLQRLFALAWPILISRSTQVVIGLADALMVAHLGQDALAATTTAAFNTYTLLIFPMGITFIVSSFASQLFGAGDMQGARRYGVYGLFLAVAAQGVGLLAIPTLSKALSLFAYTPPVRVMVEQYLAVRFLSVGAAVGSEALTNFYGGIGNTRLPMVMNVLAMVINVGGNGLLIDGRCGLPALGVLGAAWASTMSNWVVFVVFASIFFRSGRKAGQGGKAIPRGLSWSECRRMLTFGVPSGFNWFFEFLAFSAFVNVVVAGLGTTALAAFMAVMQINSVAFMPAWGFSSAGAILVGQSIGAGQKYEVPRLLRWTWGVAAGWQGLISSVYLLAPTFLLEPFATSGTRAAGFLVVGARMLRWSSAWQLFDATVGAFSETLRATGDTAFPMWSRIVLAWLVFLPGAWISVHLLGHGDVAALWWVVLYMGLLAIALLWRFSTGRWREIRLVEGKLAH